MIKILDNACGKNVQLLGAIALMVLASRAIIYGLAYGGLVLFQDTAPGFWASFETLWTRWDAVHYLAIAQNGYVASPDGNFTIVFGPLFPLLTRILHGLTHNFFLAGILVSNVCLIAAGFFLFKLTRLDHDEDTAWRALKFLLIYPFSFFLSSPFSESTFLMFFILSVYLFRQQHWRSAGLSALLTILARPSAGTFLLIILFIESAVNPDLKEALSQRNTRRFTRLIVDRLPAVLGVISGMFLYLLLNKIVLGNWLAYLSFMQTKWFHHFTWPGDCLLDQFRQLSIYTPSGNIALWVPQICSLFTAATLTILAAGRLRLSYVIYLAAFLYLTLSVTWLLSGARYIATLFPLFIILGVLSKNKITDFILTFASLMLLAFYTLAFTKGSYLM
ncbi:MAG: hypothetical protein HQL22_03605 [Candidatus Omnitrophica bacterium]|nr:hypothetical protein [Candidatus Omnitrophota bacterium]